MVINSTFISMLHYGCNKLYKRLYLSYYNYIKDYIYHIRVICSIFNLERTLNHQR
jgi:hypothetical protein